MKCLMCKRAEPQQGYTKVSFARGEFQLEVRDVPALVCPLCGEAYAGEVTTRRLLEMALRIEAMGTKVEIRSFEREFPENE